MIGSSIRAVGIYGFRMEAWFKRINPETRFQVSIRACIVR